MDYELFGGSKLELEAQRRYDKQNFALSAKALVLGVGVLIKDKQLQKASSDFWAATPKFPGNTVHHFLTDKPPGINLEWWCKRWLVPRLVTVSLTTANPGWSAEYTFSEGWTGATCQDDTLSVVLNHPSDVEHSNWTAVIKVSDSEGPMIGPPYGLPRMEENFGDDFTWLVNSIQNGLTGASYTRIPNDNE